jgi:hypothetical protein
MLYSTRSPLTYFIDLARYSTTGISYYSLPTDLAVLVVFTLLFLLVSIKLHEIPASASVLGKKYQNSTVFFIGSSLHLHLLMYISIALAFLGKIVFTYCLNVEFKTNYLL